MIDWKTDRIKKEYFELPVHNKKLDDILHMGVEYCEIEFKKPVVLTCIYRSEEENKALYAPNPEPIWKPHTTYSAVDLRSSIYTGVEIVKLVAFFNQFTVWQGTRKACVYHQIPGNAPHFHLQSEVVS